MKSLLAMLRRTMPGAHSHHWRMHEEFTAPVGAPPGHTKFILMVCDECRTVDPWPRTNWNLIDQGWRDKAVGAWKENNISLAEEEKA